MLKGVVGNGPALSIGSLIGGTPASVLFVGPLGEIAQDNAGLSFDATTDILTVGGGINHATSLPLRIAGTAVLTIAAASITAAQPILLASGTEAAPGLAFSADASSGMFRAAASRIGFTLDDGVGFYGGGASQPAFFINRDSAGFTGGVLHFGVGGAGDLDILFGRDAANTLAQRNGTNAQSFGLYNTYTNGSTYERLSLYYVSNIAHILTEQSNGTARAMRIGTTGSAAVNIFVNNAGTWQFSTGSHLFPLTGNASDIAATGTGIRSIYVGTSIQIEANGFQKQTATATNSMTSNKLLYGATTDAATTVELTTDGAAGSGATNRIAVPANAALSVVVNIAVKQSGSANAKQMLRQFVISNNGGTTAIQGTVVTLGTDSGSAGLATVACTITANDTDDAINVSVTGVIATNLRYTAYLVSTEVIYS